MPPRNNNRISRREAMARFEAKIELQNRKRVMIEADDVKREVVLKEEGVEEYAQVMCQELVENGKGLVMCMDGFVRTCHVHSDLFLFAGDIILVRKKRDRKALRIQEVVAILCYEPEEAKLLKAHGLLPMINEGIADGTGADEDDIDNI